MTATLSKSQKTASDIVSLLRARSPLLWVVTREEARVEGFLFEAAGAAGFKTLFWDCAQGVTTLDGTKQKIGAQDPGDTLNAIRDAAEQTQKPERQVWVMRDLPVWLEGTPGAAPIRSLRNLAKLLPSVGKKSAQAIIILTTSAKVPDDLAGHVTVIDFPLPDRSEIESVLDAAINSLPDDLKTTAVTAETRDACIDAAVGLTADEAAACYAKSLVQFRRVDAHAVADEKKRVISREKVLTWHEPLKGGLDAVGGLDVMKSWVLERKDAYTPEAQEYGLRTPKGIAIVGMSGCGKSLTAKGAATALEVPLLRLDMGALKSKFVGDSEGLIRKALGVVDAIGRCVLWIDEIEKAMQGATSGSADGGVSADALGVVLNWMQERTSPAFIIATANDISALPPELLRKGRIDEKFFVDLPNHIERISVLKAALTANGRSKLKVDFEAIADATEAFTSSEIAELVPTALFVGFRNGRREITTADLIKAASEVYPLSKSAADKVSAVREWGQKNARAATSPMAAVEGRAGRVIDLD